mgnify:CR=1 FL=1
MKVTERIYLVKDPPFTEGFASFTGVYILLDKEICLVDTGYRTTPEERIFPYLDQLGRSPSEISLIVLTHGHGDHYEGIPAIKKASGAKVAVHEADAWLIEEDGDAPLFRSLSAQYPSCFRPRNGQPHPKADILLMEGDTLNIGGGEFQVLSIPGHTEGSIALYQPKECLALTGDEVSGDFMHFYHDPDLCIASDRKLLSFKIDMLLAAHRYPPAPDAILKGSEVRAFIERHVAAIETAKRRTKEVLMAASKPLSPQEVAEALKGPTLITVMKILENLAQQGEALAVKAETKYW